MPDDLKPTRTLVISNLDFKDEAHPAKMDGAISAGVHMFLRAGAFNLDERKALLAIIAAATSRQEKLPTEELCGVHFANIDFKAEVVERLKGAGGKLEGKHLEEPRTNPTDNPCDAALRNIERIRRGQ